MSATNKEVRTSEPRAAASTPARRSDARDHAKQCVAVNELMAIVRDKWTVLVLGALTKEPSLRYNELQRRVVGISQRMLTLTLKMLEENGLVTRTLYPSVPPRVDYALTPLGRSLSAPLKGLLDWSVTHREAVADARRAYGARSSRTAGDGSDLTTPRTSRSRAS